MATSFYRVTWPAGELEVSAANAKAAKEIAIEYLRGNPDKLVARITVATPPQAGEKA